MNIIFLSVNVYKTPWTDYWWLKCKLKACWQWRADCKKLSFLGVRNFRNEPPPDKTNNVVVRPAKTQISLGIHPVWSESSLCTQWVAKDAQADLSLRWAHNHIVGFVMRWLSNYDFIKTWVFTILEAFEKLILAIIFGVRIFRVFEILEKLPYLILKTLVHKRPDKIAYLHKLYHILYITYRRLEDLLHWEIYLVYGRPCVEEISL